MNTIITIGVICMVGLGVYFLPKVGNFIESFINFNFRNK